MESARVEPPRLPGSKGKLNVILHGLFVFVHNDKKREITAYIPNMGSEHQYKAGNWLAETNLAEHGDFELQRVTAGTDKLVPEKNLIVEGVRVPTNLHGHHSIYATLRFPYPAYPIKSMGRLVVPPGSIGGDDKQKIVGYSQEQALHSATVQVFTYDFDSDAELRLGNHPWEPVLNDGYANLHIISEPERRAPEHHVRQAFQASMALFVGLDVSLRRPMLPADLDGEKKELPAGVHELELQAVVRRQRWLSVLGRAIKDSRDLNGLWDDPTPFDGSDPDTCPSCGGH